MEASLENKTEEVKRLRNCLNDLVSLLALPALWTGQEPPEIAQTLLDALFSMLRLDFICVRLDDLAGSAPCELIRVAGQQPVASQVGRALTPWLSRDDFAAPLRVPNPVGHGEVQIARFSLGLRQENGLIVAGSRRPDFPTETETLLLKIATNQAAIALEGAQLASQRKQAEEALRQRTAQFETLLNEAPLGVYLVDADFRIRQANPTALPVFGDIPDLIGRDFAEVIHILWPQVYADEIVQIFRHTLATGEPYFTPERIEQRRDRGVVEYYEWQANRIPLPDGRYGVVCYFRDISAQVLARLTIAESEKRYRGIFNQSIAGLAETDATGRFTNINERYCEMVGYPHAELLQMRMQEITHPEDLPRNLALFEKLIADGASFDVEKRYVRKDGAQIWVHNSVSPLHRAAGKTQSLFAISIDITERKRAEQRLLTQDTVTRALAESATLNEAAAKILRAVCKHLGWQVGVLWYVDQPEKLLRCAEVYHLPVVPIPQFEAICRQRTFEPGSGLPGRVWASSQAAWVPEVVKDANFPRAPFATAEGLHSAFGSPIVLNHEVLGVIEFFSQEIRQPDEDLLRMMTAIGSQIGQFIERKRAEAALRESEARFRNMADNAPVMVWVTEPDATCTYLSKSWYEFTGQLPETGLGFGWVSAVHPDDQHYVHDTLIAANARHEAFQLEYRLRRHNGEYRWAIDAATPRFSPGGEFLGYIGSVIDITERKQVEEALKEADRRKDEFLALLAHELRNPLAPIRNATQVMKRVGPADSKHQLAREVIERQTQHLSRLVDDLLDVSRITRGKITLQPEPLELAAVINRAVETSRPLLDTRRHQLELNLPAEPLRLAGDLTRLVQVVANLLNNAAKYTDEGGHIQLQAAREANEVVIRVRDDGVGLSPELLPRVFDLFTQADRSLDRSQGGLGVGLTLVRRLVELHGGRVEAKSEGAGRGSEFIVWLPALAARQAPAATEPAAAHPQPALFTLKILVVEDNLDSAEMMRFMLSFDGHEVRTARDGQSALAMASLFNPQVVLCDIGLPGMNGFEVAQRLRAQPAFKQTPLIALTGYSQEETRRRIKEAGFDYHLIKPIEPEALTALLGSLRATLQAH